MEPVLRVAIEDALKELGVGPVDFVVEHPKELSHGDYACNVAMVAAKLLGKNPRELAEEIKSKLGAVIEATQVDEIQGASEEGEGGVSKYTMTEDTSEATKKFASCVASIEVAGPGFINFHLAREFFTEEIARIGSEKEGWGTNDAWKDKVAIIEYTDPNPFKELHIGHLVPNALGESLARLFMYAGADTKRVTFQGDVGMHVAKAIYGLKQNGNTVAEGFDAKALGAGYATGATAFEADEEVAAQIKSLNKTIYERSDEEINALYDYGKRVSLEYFEKAYTILGSQFDHNFFESVTGPVGLEIVKAHIGDVFEESEGAVIFRGEEYGLHTRVFVNKEGLPTYETKDVGLIQCKEDWSKEVTGKPFDLTITVTGTEQQEYFKVTTKASELIQPDLAGKVELVANGMLRLKEGKMSSRTGQVVPALSLIEEIKDEALARMTESGIANAEEVASDVAVAALKYTILKIAAGKDIVFDLKKSVSFEGDSGPYLQYTNARINSVLKKATDAGIVPSIQHAPETPYEIEKILYRFPEVVEEALTERAPHLVVTFLTELAGVFNTFYGQEKIADPSDTFAPYKAAVATAVGQTLKNGLFVLGIKAPERM